jgi:hypothetical protein
LGVRSHPNRRGDPGGIPGRPRRRPRPPRSRARRGVVAATDPSSVPPNWHVHDGQTALGSQHKGIGFFPAILGQSVADYVLDPARCPNATDKAFLPSADTSEGPFLRAGICMTSTATIHLRTVPSGTSGPEGWSSITVASEPGWVTYTSVTSN